MVNRTAADSQPPLGSAPRQLQGPFTRWPGAADTVLAIALFLLIAFVSFEEADGEIAIRALDDVPVGDFLVVGVACAALIWRRSQPLVVLGVTLAAIGLSSALGYPETVGFAMLVALYSVGRYVTDDRLSYIGVG